MSSLKAVLNLVYFFLNLFFLILGLRFIELLKHGLQHLEPTKSLKPPNIAIEGISALLHTNKLLLNY